MTAVKAPTEYRSGFCGVAAHERCRGAYAGADCCCGCHQALAEPEPVLVTVHCFFGCDHVAHDEDPQAAHDAMEEHYRARHWQRIRELVGWTKGERWAVTEQQP